jgi:putative spermidine/putrescine transport system substrate-binding protein
VPATARRFLTADEWDFWYDGKPAASPVTGALGEEVARQGAVRFGGGLWDRIGRIACWNTVMDEHDYLARRWDDFRDA